MFRLLSRNTSYVSELQMARYLVTDSQYGFLKQLGLTTENPGLYDGEWRGSGEVFYVVKINLKTNELMNNLKTVSE